MSHSPVHTWTSTDLVEGCPRDDVRANSRQVTFRFFVVINKTCDFAGRNFELNVHCLGATESSFNVKDLLKYSDSAMTSPNGGLESPGK